ncbi:MAG TPA: MarR family transcriptional regulator [Mycobacterium sp.]|nr:MarR family transcriptional regulator [Mycobacterium sp.]
MAKHSTSPGHSGLGSVPIPAAALGGPISHAIFRIARLHKMMAGNLLRRLGLHPGQEMVMMYLWELGPQRQTDLIRLMDSDAATMTRTIQRLEHAGFVRRSPCADDKRAYLIESTAAGRALRPQVEQIWIQLEEIVVGGAGERERQTTQRVLKSLEERLTHAAESRV